ncbi:PAM16 [Auxenochlorella protothecoides x Auxenochlorella symbiontica]
MAARILANLAVAGATVLFRAATQAYRQALVNAQKSGVTADSVGAAARLGKQLTRQEAEQILGIEAGATWEEISKKYEHLYKKNEEAGSFYLQSKVYRAKERIEQDLQAEGVPTPDLTDIHTQQQQQQQQQGATGKDA